MLKAIRRWLHNRAANPRQNFLFIVSGFLMFAVGVACILFAQYGLHDSFSAELTALCGLILAGGGSILTLLGYISLSVLRIFSFLDSDNDERNSPP